MFFTPSLTLSPVCWRAQIHRDPSNLLTLTDIFKYLHIYEYEYRAQ